MITIQLHWWMLVPTVQALLALWFALNLWREYDLWNSDSAALLGGYGLLTVVCSLLARWLP